MCRQCGWHHILCYCLPCCAQRRKARLVEAAECELLLSSIETLQERLDGLVVDVRAAQQQSRSAEHAELRSIRAEHEDVSGAAARAEKGLRGVEHRRAELQTQLQQRSSELRRLERQRQQLTEELEMGEASMRHAESGVHEARGVAESVLVALKQKVHELTEMASDQAAMEELYTTQIRTLEAQLHTMDAEAEQLIDQEGLKQALLEFAASSDFEAHFETIASMLRLTLQEARRCKAQRQMQLDQDPFDPK